MLREDHSLSESLLYNYQSTHLLGYEVTHNRIVFLTNNHLTLVNMQSSGPSGLTSILKVNGKNVVRFSTDKKNMIAILYANGVLEVRSLDSIEEIKYKFTNVECRKGTNASSGAFTNRGSNTKSTASVSAGEYPKIYWQKNQIYLLYQDQIELINMGMKERKTFNDIIHQKQQKQQAISLCLSRLIRNERVIVLQLKKKLQFNIIPIPITYMEINNVTQMEIVSSHLPFDNKGLLKREYLVLVVDGKILQIYNIINMKLIMEINYEPGSKNQKKKGDKNLNVQFQTDSNNQYLLVELSRGKQVQHSILYKINTDYYYPPSEDYFKEEEPFLLWEIKIPVPFPLLLLPGHCLSINHSHYYSLEMCYFKHDPVYGVGEINHAAMMVKGQFRTPINNSRRKVPDWKQLREWKDIITSYNEMKNTLDHFNMGDFDEESDIDQSNSKLPELEENFNDYLENKKKKQIMEKESEFTEGQKKFDKEQSFDEQKYFEEDLDEDVDKEYQKYEHIKNCLEDAAKKFQAEKMIQIEEVGSSHDERRERQLQAEFYKFMQAYLKENNLDVSPDDLLLEFQREESSNKNNEDLKEGYELKNNHQLQSIQTRTKNSTITVESGYNDKKLKRPIKQSSNQSKEQIVSKPSRISSQSKQEQLKPQEKIVSQQKTAQKSDKKLQNNLSSSSLLNNSKSGGQMQNSKQILNKKSMGKIRTNQDQEQLEVQSLSKTNFLQPECEEYTDNGSQFQKFDEEKEQVNELFLGIEKAINRGFEPLQKKLDHLNNHIQRYEHIHVSHLNKCAKIVQDEKNYLNNVDSVISGYCNEFMVQFNHTLEKGLKTYWQKIQQIDRKSAKERDKTITQFGSFIDQQIKNREILFDANRMSIQNHLSHIRKKIHLGQDPFHQEEAEQKKPKRLDEEIDVQEEFEDDCIQWFKNLREKQNPLFKY